MKHERQYELRDPGEPRFVDELEPGYQNQRKDLKAKAYTQARAFGHDVDRIGLAPYKAHINTVLATQGEAGSVEVSSIFWEALQYPEIRQASEVQKITRGMVGDPRANLRLLEAYEAGELSDALLTLVLQKHVDTYAQSVEKFNAELPEIVSSVQKNIQRLIDDPLHPLTRNMLPARLVQRRIQEVALVALDPLEVLSRKTNVVIGEYSAHENYAGTFYDRPSVVRGRHHDLHRDIIGHELMHTLSGRTIVQRDEYYLHGRIGLRTSDSVWFNESVTETLNQDLWGKRQYLYGSYVPERGIYKALIQKIPEKLILNAYFENTHGEDTPKERNPHYKKLVAALNKAYFNNFITLMDSLVIREGVEAVEDYFDSEGNFHRPTRGALDIIIPRNF